MLHGIHFRPNLSWGSNWPLETARFLAPAGELAIPGIGVVELIMLGSDQFRLALFSLSRRKHAVVCGLGTKGLQLVRDLRRQGHRVLVIEKDSVNPFVASCDALGAVVLIGDATAAETLRQARLRQAEYLIAVCGSDGANVEIAVRADQLLSESPRPATNSLPCYLHIVDLELRTLFRQHWALTRLRSGLEVEIFNVFENGVRLLFGNHFLDHDKAITEENDSRQVHLVVVGFGPVGESVVLQAVRLAHFPNEKKLRLTVIDKDGELRHRRFLLRYESFHELCEARFVQAYAENPELLAALATALNDATNLPALERFPVWRDAPPEPLG
jgi:voltage-gated potassium channel Kch